MIQTTEAIRNQVEGEACFGRAYYHFMLLTQYCLWGTISRVSVTGTIHDGRGSRTGNGTYTLEHIYEDLRLAEEALIKGTHDV